MRERPGRGMQQGEEQQAIGGMFRTVGPNSPGGSSPLFCKRGERNFSMLKRKKILKTTFKGYNIIYNFFMPYSPTKVILLLCIDCKIHSDKELL